MNSLAKTIATLEDRRTALARELGQIDGQLAAVAALLDGANARKDKNRSNADKGPPRAAATRAVRKSWFAREEASKLLRKIARTAKPAADLVREIATVKGYAGKLSPDDMRRFQGAAFMAINQAIKAGALKRRKDGALQSA